MRFHMPDEGAPHARTWMALPTRRAIWGRDLPAIQTDLIRIADTIAAFEPVSMLVEPADMDDAANLLSATKNRAQISLVAFSFNDLWLRDSGPIFVQAGAALRAIDFNFNGWGGKQPHRRDAKVAGFIADHLGLACHRSRLVLEGGAIEVDGAGTAILKESCILNPNRNPGLAKSDCEQTLMAELGLEKIIWLPGPAGGDITDGHTDFYARFAGSGVVVVHHDANNVYGEKDITQAHIETLRSARDAAGRSLSLEVIKAPDAPDAQAADSEDFAAGYINYYLCNGALILPCFGDAAADAAAQQTLAQLYPHRHIVPIRIDAIAAGGGGIHCTTQQQPAALT